MYEIQISVSMRQILLSLSHARLSRMGYERLCAPRAKLSPCGRDRMAGKLHILTIWPFTGNVC